ncbi:MAG: hypothetical protein ACT4P2_13200 [Pseudomonadota bacterium]
MRELTARSAALILALGLCPIAGQAEEPLLPVRFGTHPTFTRMVFDWPQPVDYRLDEGAAVTLSFDRGARVDAALIAARLAPVAGGVKVETKDGRLAVSMRLADGIRVRHFRSGTKVAIDFIHGPASAPAPAERAPDRLPPAPNGAPPEPPGATMPVASARPLADHGATVAVDIVRTADGHGLRFAWLEPVAAAVFERGQHLVVVFGRRAVLDLKAVDAHRDLLGAIETIESDGLALRLAPTGGPSSAVRREGNSWIVELGRASPAASERTRIAVRHADEPLAARLLVALAGAQAPIWVRDPEAGALAVLPSAVAGARILEDHVYLQFRLPRTAQGAVVLPLADDLAVRPLGDMFEISSARGLHVSPAPEQALPLARAGAPRLFDFPAWRGAGDFFADRQARQRAVILASEEKRSAARLALARFLFAHGQAADTLGLLRLIEQDDPDLVGAAELRAMRGVSALISGQRGEAADHLGHASLEGEPEAALWRGVLAVERGNSTAAMAEVARGSDFTGYPPRFANRLALAAAEARLGAGDHAGVRAHLDAVLANHPTVGERARCEYLRGRLALAEGDAATAAALWAEVENGAMTPARVAAALARLDLRLAGEEIKPETAIAELERLGYAWRGDELEFAVLQRRGRLQLANREVRRGLLSLRRAATHFPDHTDTKAVVEEMSQAFERFYLDGGLDRVTPVAAIGLFDEFRELTPPGERGDAIVARLAERLIAVDLLERADELLENQMAHRLSGADQAAAGARLAFVRLLDRRPQGALDALRASRVEDLPAELHRDRARLAARALADLGRTAEAVARLEGDQAAEGQLLRADIYWQAQNWAAAAEALQPVVGAPPTGNAPLPEEQARRAIHLAVALALTEDEAGAKRLADRFGPALERGPYKDVFRVLTSARRPPPADMAQVAARLATAAPFQSFLAGYRARFATGGKTLVGTGS